MNGTVDRTGGQGPITTPLPDMKTPITGNSQSTPPLIPGAGESAATYGGTGPATLPDLELPTVTLTMGGLSLESLLEAVGFEQRRTETRAGIASMEAHAQERAMANEEKLQSIQEQLEKSRSRGFLDGLLKAFKYIGMALAAVASVAMIAVGAAGAAAGGSGVALIALGVASMALLVSSITEEATGGKAGFSPGFIIGKIMEACGASESAVAWTKMAVDLACTIALTVASFGVGAVGGAGKAARTAGSAASTAASTAASAKGAAAAADVAAATAKAAQTVKHVAGIVARATSAMSAGMGMMQAGTGIASAVNERDMSYLKAQQKRLEAILEKIALANELDMEHLKEMLRRTEQTLQTVSEIVQEGVQTNTAIMTGNPAMA